jgi:arsenate reductase
MLDGRQEILKTLRATPVVLRALVADVDEAGLRRRPAPGSGPSSRSLGTWPTPKNERSAGCDGCWPRTTRTWNRSTRKRWPSSAVTWTSTFRRSWLAWSSSVASISPSPAACRRLVPGPEHAPPTPVRPSRQGGPAMPDGQRDPLSRSTFARSIESLAEEFRGIYSLETIERFMDESIDRMSGARVVDFIPLFVHRFARERLRALAQAQGAIIKDVPEVLFVCVHNAGRSQMAAALLDHHAKGKVHVRSAGSAPADQINPAVAAAMDEWSIDLSREFPKPLTDEFVRAADVVITMGCGDACPIYPGKRYEDWQLQDPAGQPVEDVRRIRDDIDTRVQQLLGELVPAGA